jgi:hypothetical protein
MKKGKFLFEGEEQVKMHIDSKRKPTRSAWIQKKEYKEKLLPKMPAKTLNSHTEISVLLSSFYIIGSAKTIL